MLLLLLPSMSVDGLARLVHTQVQAIAPTNSAYQPGVILHGHKRNAIMLRTVISNARTTDAIQARVQLSSLRLKATLSDGLDHILGGILDNRLLGSKTKILVALASVTKIFLFHHDIDHGHVHGPGSICDKDGQDNIDRVVKTGCNDIVETDGDIDVGKIGDPLVTAVQAPLDGASDPMRKRWQ